jgi:hypothetical protein
MTLMGSLWIGLVLGLFIGASIGAVVMGCLAASRDARDEY